MLDNEPTGGSVVGENPTADAVETTEPAQKPARRRATRRTAPPAPAADTELTSENAESTAAEPAKAPAKRASRARKKAVPTPDAEPAAGATPSVETGTAADAVPIPDAEAADTAGQPAKKVAKRTTRSRKKAAPPAEPVTDEPVTVEPGAAPTQAADAAKVEDEQAEPAAQGQPASAPAMAAPPVVMFMAPDRVAAKPPTPVVATPFAPGDDEETPAPTKRSRSRRRSAAAAEPEPIPAEEPTEVAGEVPEGESAEEDDDSAERRRRRRGRRGRGRGRGGEESDSDETTEDGAEDTAAEADEEPEETRDGDEEAAEGGTRRRRRRRRRGSAGGDDQAPDDPPNTVVRVREPAPAATRSSFDDEVQGVKGSTRLEAKRQRRRDGRDQSRRRPPVLSEAEFLARREAVERVMVVRQLGDRTQIAVLEDDVLVEHYVTKASSASYAGNVYLGKVQNVLPSMEAAFVDIGKGRNAVLYAGEVNWDSAGMAGKPRKIEQALKSGDAVLVQVTKDPIGHKGARLTSQISLPGRFLVYVPEGQMTGISRKLPENERKRLKDILKKIVPENAGVIIRTAAEGASEEELSRDVARLEAQWQSIKTKSEKGGAPALLHAEPDLVIRVIRDIFNEDFTKLIVQGNEAWDTVDQYVAHVSPDLVERLSRHTGESDVFHDLRIDEQLTKALDRKVWLPSGGSLVIDRTEAMTVVDVNTGKFTGQGGNLEETVTRNNLEAAEEIVRQLRLRDIGGIIVIDFIDMVLEGNRDLVLRRLTECLGRDRTKHQVAEVTSLGLVQMTRKRVGQGLLEVFSEVCEHCRGRGIIIRSEPVGERPKPVLPVAATATAEPKSRKRRGRGRGGDVEPVEPAPVPAVVTAATTDGAPAHPDEAAPIEHVAAVPVEHVAAVPVEHVAADSAAPTGHAAAAEADGRPVVQVASVEPASVEPAAPSVNGAAPDGQPVRERNGVHPPAAEPPATEPVEQREPATAVPAPRKRARRAASRPAGPPVVD